MPERFQEQFFVLDSFSQLRGLLKGLDYLFTPEGLGLWKDILTSWENGKGPGETEAELLLSTHLNKQDDSGNTALMRAALNRNPYLTKRLLQRKPPLRLDIKNGDQENALIPACYIDYRLGQH